VGGVWVQATPEKTSLTRLVGQVDRFQVDVFCKAAQKQGQGGRMNLFKKASAAKSGAYTVEDMLTFSKVPPRDISQRVQWWLNHTCAYAG
jgi:hypothetical protein